MHAVVHLIVSHLRVYRTVYGIHIPDKVRFMSITNKVRYTRNTDFVYNGQKTLVPTGTLYARFTVFPFITKFTFISRRKYTHELL